MEKSKITQVLDIGLDVIRSGRLFGLVSQSEARRGAFLSFVGGTLFGGGIATYFFMRGDTANVLRERLNEIRGDVMSRVGQIKEKAERMGQESHQAS